MRRHRVNRSRLPRVALPEGVRVTSDVAALDADCLLLAIPAQALGRFLDDHGPALDTRDARLLRQGDRPGDGPASERTRRRRLPRARVASLTGPSFAEDIAAGLPTALTLAMAEGGEDLQARLSTRGLRLYLTHDVIGAELGGALKNVIALAAGITIGAGLGESARAAVVTRGFAEIARYATVRGAEAETLTGLSGLGDLLLTCTSPKSRNYAAGLAIGAGRPRPRA
jgi:glycerol-3-phosphate dehydrogenase (NAD(P)+)